MNSWRPRASLETLRARLALVERVRRFFAARGVLEVDTPLLQPGANLDHGVMPMVVFPAGTAGSRRAAVGGYNGRSPSAHDSGADATESSCDKGWGAGPQGRGGGAPEQTANLDHGVVPMRVGDAFLPTSPEHALKRLVAAHRQDVWTLAPAFRAGERGVRHQPEFRMLEWYRLGWDDLRLADEVVALLRELTDLPGPAERLSWRDAWARAGLDPDAVQAADGFTRDERLDLLLTERVEPLLGRGGWTILTGYPASGAAQARVRTDATGRPVAARFELYRDGIELANGYHECADAAELRARHQAELPLHPGCTIDEQFHACLADGFPDCAGVAVGFDRVVMLALGLPDVASTMV